MEVESFENEEVARLLNDWFVSIKVSGLFFSHFDFTCLPFQGYFIIIKKCGHIFVLMCYIL